MRKFSMLIILLVMMQGGLFAQAIADKDYLQKAAMAATADITKGEIMHFTFKKSKIYPGTTRSYWVYVPKEYRAGKPACLYVCMDGIAFNAPEVFDRLIAKKEMPVTIGVFIESGTMLLNDSVVRYNRTNEFDNMNGRFAEFIEKEILPDVIKQKTADGRAINLSPNAGDHAIAGYSSGAICAFTAAWQRPDLFSRVFSAIGTYVGMRGGDQYPVLIRKTEPRAIRVYLQDNKNDTWNPAFGNWFKANLDMEATLNFSGYQVTHMWQEGGHEVGQATAIFADAMRWLWKGWPLAVRSGSSANDFLRAIIDTNEHWQSVEQKKAVKTFAGNAVVLPGGSGYSLHGGTIFYKTKRGLATVDKNEQLGYALAISPEKKRLVVSARHSHWLFDYTIMPDGQLSNRQTLYWLHNPGNDDTSEVRHMAFDTNGNLYVATSIGVQVCDQNGRVRAILSVPTGAVTSLWFGGEKFNTLFIACGKRLYKRKLNATGAPSTQKAITVLTQGEG
jgi:gluconolactonase